LQSSVHLGSLQVLSGLLQALNTSTNNSSFCRMYHLREINYEQALHFRYVITQKIAVLSYFVAEA